LIPKTGHIVTNAQLRGQNKTEHARVMRVTGLDWNVAAAANEEGTSSFVQ
jgi:hypothetical protein